MYYKGLFYSSSYAWCKSIRAVWLSKNAYIVLNKDYPVKNRLVSLDDWHKEQKHCDRNTDFLEKDSKWYIIY